MDEYGVEVGTRERAFEVSHLSCSERLDENRPLQDLRELQSAAERLQLRASSFHLILTNSCECSACLRIVGEFLPLRAPVMDRSPVLRARGFRNFRCNTRVVRGEEAITFLDTDLVRGAGSGARVGAGGCG